jgi:hypothetical protein
MDARNLRIGFSRRNVLEEQAVYFSAEWQN